VYPRERTPFSPSGVAVICSRVTSALACPSPWRPQGPHAHSRPSEANNQPCFSFEFFPPRTREGAEQLYKTMVDLVLLRASYVA